MLYVCVWGGGYGEGWGEGGGTVYFHCDTDEKHNWNFTLADQYLQNTMLINRTKATALSLAIDVKVRDSHL